jgi:hypothetical protein
VGTAAAGRGPGRKGGRATQADRGIVFQWEDCKTAYVRGSEKKLDSLTILYWLCYDKGGPCPDGLLIDVEPDLPLTVDDRFLGSDHPEYYIYGFEYERDGIEGYVTLPPEWDCGF